jgi:hypothetical protein
MGLSLIVCLGLSEIGLRLFFRKSFNVEKDPRTLLYRYDETLGWFPKANSQGVFTGSRTINVVHNSRGFRDREPVKSAKPVLMVLGDSFVWGFDVEAQDRFTDKLQEHHPEWTILNCGVSGFGTDQEFLLLQRHFDDIRPRIVLLIYCSDNDDLDNSWNIRPGGYYKPFYTLPAGTFTLRGVPVPRSERVFCSEHRFLCRSYTVRLLARAYYKLVSPAPTTNDSLPGAVTGVLLKHFQSYLESRGTLFMVGIQGPHLQLEQYLDECRIPHVDLTTTLDSHRFAGLGSHWTAEGHSFVCDKIEEFLVKGGYLQNPSTPPR